MPTSENEEETNTSFPFVVIPSFYLPLRAELKLNSKIDLSRELIIDDSIHFYLLPSKHGTVFHLFESTRFDDIDNVIFVGHLMGYGELIDKIHENFDENGVNELIDELSLFLVKYNCYIVDNLIGFNFNLCAKYLRKYLWQILHDQLPMTYQKEEKQSFFDELEIQNLKFKNKTNKHVLSESTDSLHVRQCEPSPWYSDAYNEFRKMNVNFAKFLHEKLIHIVSTDLTKYNELVLFVQDFQLLLLGDSFRQELNEDILNRYFKKISIGLFLHTPFPTSDMYQYVPSRQQFLMQILRGFDVISFQFFEYANHFMASVRKTCHISHTSGRGGFLILDTRPVFGREVFLRVHHTIIPTSWIENRILPKDTLHLSNHIICGDSVDDVKLKIFSLRDKWLPHRNKGVTHVMSVDRCERLSGLILKFRIFSHFLRTHPYYIHKVKLIQYCFRHDSSESQSKENRLLAELNRIADETNALYRLHDYHQRNSTQRSFVGWRAMPRESTSSKEEADSLSNENEDFKHIEVIFASSFSPIDRLAVLMSADLVFDTSIKDGLNLVPFEFYALRDKFNFGMVICSEFSGVSNLLLNTSRINPWNVDEVVHSLDTAMTTVKNIRDGLSVLVEEGRDDDSIVETMCEKYWHYANFLGDLTSVKEMNLKKWFVDIIDDISICSSS